MNFRIAFLEVHTYQNYFHKRSYRYYVLRQVNLTNFVSSNELKAQFNKKKQLRKIVKSVNH